MTTILCAYCAWQGLHLRALWNHLAVEHPGVKGAQEHKEKTGEQP